MRTRIIRIGVNNIDPKKISLVAKIIKKGGLVAFPTETVYGLGADALKENAVKKIFQVKRRPRDDPIIVHVSSLKDVYKLAREVPNEAKKLMKKFWPGPLTLVLKKSKSVPDVVTANLDTVAIRMPSHPVAHALIKSAKTPIAAPSANLFGKPSPTKAEHVMHDLKGRVDIIIDSGETNIGLESTVIDLSSPSEGITLLRPGGVILEELKEILGKIEIHPVAKATKVGMKLEEKIVKSPGMKYRHYAPDAKVILIEGSSREVKKKIQTLSKNYKAEGKKVGVMLTANKENNLEVDSVKMLGNGLNEVAKNIFKTFRELDEEGMDVILVEGVETKGLGLAIMNRLRKASL